MFNGRNIHYEVAEKRQAINCGGIGAIHQMVQRCGLVEEINTKLKLPKIHVPYHESDHVLNIAYKGIWGYSPLIVSLANTKEVLCLENRPGNVASHDGSVKWIDRAIEVVEPYAEGI